jgi:DNA-3-methyladenine glycosylase
VASSFHLLDRAFFLPAPDTVARGLRGNLLLRHLPGAPEPLVGRIVETEAYFGEDDPAAHAFSGRTARNAVLWGEPGYAYVYLIYGMHTCLNVACEPAGHAGCVLIRALEPVTGIAEMARLRGISAEADPRLLTGGPGRLSRAFGITRAFGNGLDLLSSESSLQLVEDDFAAKAIAVTPRIGIRKAADRPLRFLLAGHPCVSGAGRRTLKRVQLDRARLPN